MTHTLTTKFGTYYRNGRFGSNFASVQFDAEGRYYFSNGYDDLFACRSYADAIAVYDNFVRLCVVDRWSNNHHGVEYVRTVQDAA